jgi:hypothetical protein
VSPPPEIFDGWGTARRKISHSPPFRRPQGATPFPKTHVSGQKLNNRFELAGSLFGCVLRSVGEKQGKDSPKTSTAERRELGLGRRRSARFSLRAWAGGLPGRAGGKNEWWVI